MVNDISTFTFASSSAELVARTEDQLLEVRNFGATTLTEVQEKLRGLGLHLGMRVSAPVGV